jgi:hypothetical protein
MRCVRFQLRTPSLTSETMCQTPTSARSQRFRWPGATVAATSRLEQVTSPFRQRRSRVTSRKRRRPTLERAGGAPSPLTANNHQAPERRKTVCHRAEHAAKTSGLGALQDRSFVGYRKQRECYEKASRPAHNGGYASDWQRRTLNKSRKVARLAFPGPGSPSPHHGFRKRSARCRLIKDRTSSWSTAMPTARPNGT